GLQGRFVTSEFRRKSVPRVAQGPRIAAVPAWAELGKTDRDRGVDAADAKPDDIGRAFAAHIGREARIEIVAGPAAGGGAGAEAAEIESRRGEGAVAGRPRYPDPILAEADNVGLAVAGDIAHHARIGVLAGPAAGAGAEIAEFEDRLREAAVGVGLRFPHPGLAEADDVVAAVADHIAQGARVEVLADPAAGPGGE